MAERSGQAKAKFTLAEEVQKEGNLLDAIISETRIARSDTERTRAKDLIGEFVQQVLDGAVVVKKDLETAIAARIAALDEAISAQLNEVMHAPEFQKLEGSWRGLHYLVHQSETSTMLKIRVMNISKDDLRKDLERAEFDQSALFKKSLRRRGWRSAWRRGLRFGRHPQDMSFEQISRRCRRHAPFIKPQRRVC
jgi:type VI secretion system protein ImpC